MSLPRSEGTAARRRGADSTLAFVESPVQLLNVLEWAYQAAPAAPAASAVPAASAEGTGTAGRACPRTEPFRAGSVRGARASPGDGPPYGEVPGPGNGPAPEHAAPRHAVPQHSVPEDPVPEDGARSEAGPSMETSPAGGVPGAHGPVPNLTIVVLSPHDPMTRGQLRRVAELARDEGVAVRWQEAREGATAPLKTVGSLAGELRRARRVVIGDPFSRYVQLLLNLTKARDVVVVDDGTATMEFVSQLARGERFVRWHRKGSGGPQAILFAPFSRRARARLTPGGAGAGGGKGNGDGTGGGREPRRVEVFSSMPVDPSHTELAALGVTVTANGFAWTRARFGPPRLTKGTDLVGTSLVETGVVDIEHYLEAVAALARTHGATRYFAHRRENSEKLQRVTAATGLEIVRPDLPLELVARRGPIGRTILSFPSTVVHTLPLALAGTPVTVAVCEVQRAWLTEGASPRAEGFLSGVTGSARGVRRIGPLSVSEPPQERERDRNRNRNRNQEHRQGQEQEQEKERAEVLPRPAGNGTAEPSVATSTPEAGTASA